MKLTYLGTAAAEAWPGVFCNCPACREARRLGGKNIRTRSQAILDQELLLDLPCDTYLHILQNNLDLSAVHTLLVTHSHSDHFYPAELMCRGGCYAHSMTVPELSIYCNQAVWDVFCQTAALDPEPEVEKLLHFHLAQPFQPFQAGPYTVTPLPARHRPTEQALIYLIERDGKSLLYGHDTGRLFPEVYDFLKKRGRPLDAISLDCNGGPFENGEEGCHMGLPDVAIVQQKLLAVGAAGPDTQFLLNHFSHNGGLLHHELEARAAQLGMQVSYDGMTVEI